MLLAGCVVSSTHGQTNTCEPRRIPDFRATMIMIASSEHYAQLLLEKKPFTGVHFWKGHFRSFMHAKLGMDYFRNMILCRALIKSKLDDIFLQQLAAQNT